jgi:dTMP kinase
VRPGRFITLEGIEGAGKSTVARALVDTLGGRGLAVELTREPGGTPLAEQLRSLLLAPGGEALTPAAETLLMFAARSVHVENRIRPALARGVWVVCDRFTDATHAYQGGGRGVDGALIEALARAAHGALQPDRTLLLDLPVELGLARTRSRGGAADRFEAEAAAFFERVRARYLERAATDPARFRVIDAAAPLTTVQAAAVRAVDDLLRGAEAEA